VALAAALAGFGCTLEIVDTLAGAEGSPTTEALADGSDDGGFASQGDGGEDGGDSGTGNSGDSGDSGGSLPLFDVGGVAEIEVASCEFAATYPSHLGCEFYGIDVDGPGLWDFEPYGYVAINPQTTPVRVRVERYAAGEWMQVDEAEIAEFDEHVFTPAHNHAHGTGIHPGAALRISSTQPVVVIQAHPAVGAAISASATMLQPTTAWSTQTPVTGWRTHPGVGEHAHLAVVARTVGTTITLAATCGVVAAPPSWDGAWTDVNQDGEDELVLTIHPGELLRIDAEAIDAAEVDHGTSGARVSSGQEHLSSVFSAHTCASIPDYDGSCGHLQEQMVASLVGTRFVAPRLVAQAPTDPLGPWLHERTMVQAVATEPGTTITFAYKEGGQVFELESVILDAGESHAVFEHTHELTVVSDKPIVAASFMTNPLRTELGSPSMVQLAPVAQWTARHWVWAPEGFTTQLLITTTATATVEVDGISGLAGAIAPATSAKLIEVSDAATLAGQHWVVHRVEVGPGIHRVHASAPASTIVAGFRVGDGFAYLGGWGPSLVDLGPEG
jgi:hypothetical protein